MVSFEEDLNWLARRGDVVVLSEGAGGQVVVAPGYQARVLTSAVGLDADSLGWVNRAFIEHGEVGTQFDNYGGIERMWFGPEGGPYSLYFEPGAPLRIEDWRVPTALQTTVWKVEERQAGAIQLSSNMALRNRFGTHFELAVRRRISMQSAGDFERVFGRMLPPQVRFCGYVSENEVKNVGTQDWHESSGLISIWCLGMFVPTDDTVALMPYRGKDEPLVRSDYFGCIPNDRLRIDRERRVVELRCDGKHRSKVGLEPRFATNALGSYSPETGLLNLVTYDAVQPPVRYVNSLWSLDTDPYAGDVVNVYNDGPLVSGGASFGGFYELESSSPGLALKAGGSGLHRQSTWHFRGDPADLNVISKIALGVDLPVKGRTR